MLTCLHFIIFKKYINTHQESEDRFRISDKLPRGFDSVFQKIFDTFLNIPSCKTMPDLEKDWILEFLSLFHTELALNFSKSENYLKDLNKNYNNQI